MVETEGTVVLISMGTGYPQRTTLEITARALMWLLFALLMLPILIVLWVAAMLLSSGSRPSFFSRVAEHALGYGLGNRIMRRSPVPVRELRVREVQTGRIRLVRVAGHLAGGSFSRGDWITVRGQDYHGTLLFREGVNHSIQSRIVLK
jgi:hypothetical protein